MANSTDAAGAPLAEGQLAKEGVVPLLYRDDHFDPNRPDEVACFTYQRVPFGAARTSGFETKTRRGADRSKRRDRPYQHGRYRTWLKIKNPGEPGDAAGVGEH